MNLVLTGLDFTKPLLVRGQLPRGRCCSITIYNKKNQILPNTIDLSDCYNKQNDRNIEILICSESQYNEFKHLAKLHLNHQDWQRGFIALRNYGVAPGTRILTPEIIDIKNQMVLRKSEVIISGPAQAMTIGKSLMSVIFNLMSAKHNEEEEER